MQTKHEVTMNNEIQNKESQVEESIFRDISALAEQMKGIYDDAVIAYTPLVNDICNRKASEKDVSWLLSWLLDYAGDKRMLNLSKQVCRAYWQIYPSIVAEYIMDYRKEYDPESMKGTKWEYLLKEDSEDDKEV